MLVVLSKSLDASFNACKMTSFYDKVKDETFLMRDLSMRILSILNASKSFWLNELVSNTGYIVPSSLKEFVPEFVSPLLDKSPT